MVLYNSNRGQPDTVTPAGDAIVAFAVDPASGLLTLIGHTTENIGVPWSFANECSKPDADSRRDHLIKPIREDL